MEADLAALLVARDEQEKKIAQKIVDLSKGIKQRKKECAPANREARTRKLVLMGTVLEKAIAAKTHEQSQDLLDKMLEVYLDRETDRKVFGMAPLSKTEEDSLELDVEIKEIPTEISSNPDKKINKKSPKVQTEGAVV